MPSDIEPSHVLSRDAIDYVVDGIIPVEGVGLLVAEKYAGKSLALTAMALKVVNGEPFMGHETMKGDVVQCISEGYLDAGIRVTAAVLGSVRTEKLARCRGGCNLNRCTCTVKKADREEGLWFLKGEGTLSDRYETWKLIRRIRALTALKKIRNLRMVTFDTMQGFTDNISSPGPAKEVMRNMALIADELGCFVLGLHHFNQDGRTIQGSPLLGNRADVIIAIREETIQADKVKAGPPFDDMPFEIKTISWKGKDKRGNPRVIKGAFVTEPGSAAAGRRPDKPVRLPVVVSEPEGRNLRLVV
jgi:hypothetical protein